MLWIALGNIAKPSARFNSIYSIFRIYSLSVLYILRWCLFLCTVDAILVDTSVFCILHGLLCWLTEAKMRWSTLFTKLISSFYPIYKTWICVCAWGLACLLTMWLLECHGTWTLAKQLNYQEDLFYVTNTCSEAQTFHYNGLCQNSLVKWGIPLQCPIWFIFITTP